jgi:hypothetical protein
MGFRGLVAGEENITGEDTDNQNPGDDLPTLNISFISLFLCYVPEAEIMYFIRRC